MFTKCLAEFWCEPIQRGIGGIGRAWSLVVILLDLSRRGDGE